MIFYYFSLPLTKSSSGRITNPISRTNAATDMNPIIVQNTANGNQIGANTQHQFIEINPSNFNIGRKPKYKNTTGKVINILLQLYRILFSLLILKAPFEQDHSAERSTAQ